MILTIHQPEYLPWLGFFNKLMYSDMYVALDNVQYRHKYFQNRNRIMTTNGDCWVNVPVYRKGNRDLFIQDIKINNETNWREKTWKNIYFSYKKAPYFNKYSEYFENLYSKEWNNLSDLNLDIIKNICSFLNFDIEIKKASNLNIEGVGSKLILDICTSIKPDVYISGKSGIGGRGNEMEDKFFDNNIKVLYQNFNHPNYNTAFRNFVPSMSVIDLLFNYGSDSVDVLKNDGKWFSV